MQQAIHSHATSHSLTCNKQFTRTQLPPLTFSHPPGRGLLCVRQDMVSRVEIAAERAVGAFSSTVGIFSIVFLAVLVRLVLFVPHLPAD